MAHRHGAAFVSAWSSFFELLAAFLPLCSNRSLLPLLSLSALVVVGVVVVVVVPLSPRRRDNVRVFALFMVACSDILSQNGSEEACAEGRVCVGVGEHTFLASTMCEKVRRVSSPAQGVEKEQELKRIYAVLSGVALLGSGVDRSLFHVCVGMKRIQFKKVYQYP